MGCLSKGLALVLILTITLSSLTLFMVKPVYAQIIPAQSISKPIFDIVIMWFNSPQNETYNTNSILLNITLSVYCASGNTAGYIASANYTLDGQEMTALPLSYQGITGSTTGSNFERLPRSITYAVANLTEISDGEHNITVYASSKPFTAYGALYGNVTASFLVLTNSTTNSHSQSPNPSPTASIPEFSLLALVPLHLSVFYVAVIVRYREISIR